MAAGAARRQAAGRPPQGSAGATASSGGRGRIDGRRRRRVAPVQDDERPLVGRRHQTQLGACLRRALPHGPEAEVRLRDRAGVEAGPSSWMSSRTPDGRAPQVHGRAAGARVAGDVVQCLLRHAVDRRVELARRLAVAAQPQVDGDTAAPLGRLHDGAQELLDRHRSRAIRSATRGAASASARGRRA